MKIIGFYHVLLKNHWQEIVKEQLDCLVKSGLYDASEEIHIGCVGSEEEKSRLFELGLLDKYSKIAVHYFGEDIAQYEFPTLNFLKAHCDNSIEKVACYYIHTKGVSYEKSHTKGYEGGNYWRGYMNFYNITNWKNALHEIEINSCDLVGVKLRDKKSTGNPHAYLHFSGNFFWTHSDYVKQLPPIESLDQTDRCQAEFWAGKANPKTFSMCQDWVDYNTKGKWIDPVMAQKRNIVHTLCWNTFQQVELAVDDLYRRNNKHDFIHVLVDLGFPLEFGDVIPEDLEAQKVINTGLLKTLAEKYGSIYFKAENIGVSQNWTQVAKFMKVTENDVLLCADPDERVQTDGWVKAICDVMRYNKKYAWLSLYMPEYSSILNDTNVRKFKYWDTNVLEIIGGLNWAQGGMSGVIIKKMGGVIPYPERYQIYGGIESATMKHIKANAMTWGVMQDFVVVHTNEVPLLREWKDICIFKLKEYGKQITFEDFLNRKKNNILIKTT